MGQAVAAADLEPSHLAGHTGSWQQRTLDEKQWGLLPVAPTGGMNLRVVLAAAGAAPGAAASIRKAVRSRGQQSWGKQARGGWSRPFKGRCRHRLIAWLSMTLFK